MPINPYFNNTSYDAEQDLRSSLEAESIQSMGFETFYLKRELQNPDELMGEDPSSKFVDATNIEMYLVNIEQFNGDGDFFQGFLEIRDRCTFKVSKYRFKEELIGSLSMPREGDLIYVPHTKSLWEINKVRFDDVYYAHGKNYVYFLDCKLFEYSHEDIESGLPEADDFFKEYVGEEIIPNTDNIRATIFDAETPSLNTELEESPTQHFDPDDPFK